MDTAIGLSVGITIIIVGTYGGIAICFAIAEYIYRKAKKDFPDV